MTSLVLGLDLSVSATGVVMLRTPDGQAYDVLQEREIKSKKTGMARLREIALEVMQTVHIFKPHRIVLEGYGLNLKNASSVIPLVELGGLVRFMLHLDGLPWLAPSPAEVKKFATGKGNAPKDQVMMHVLKRWGHVSKTNNTADAFVCAAIGLAHLNGMPNCTKEMDKMASELKLRCN